VTQGDLFTARARARRRDPASSHEAARRAEVWGAKGQRLEALVAVKAMRGCTTAEIAKFFTSTDLEYEKLYRMLGRRLPELRENGLIANGTARKCAVRASLAMTWYPVETTGNANDHGTSGA
jgi:hypothetical protein